MKRRSRYEIFLETLETIRHRGSLGITKISYGANLPVDRASNVISYLADRGLIHEVNFNGMRCYSLTSRGGEFLQSLQTVRAFLDE